MATSDQVSLDETDLRPIAMARMLILGNPSLIYNAEDWDQIPKNRQEYVERLADQIDGTTMDGLIKNVREHYRCLDEMPTRYGIAFCAAIYLRRCNVKERHLMCPECYFYGFDDRIKFVDLFRRLRDCDEEAAKTDSGAMERTAIGKGFGRQTKNIIYGCYTGKPIRSIYTTQRPFEADWKKIIEHRSPERVVIDICANTCVHGWTHADLLKMTHLPNSEPWEPRKLGRLFPLIAWDGPRAALNRLQVEAPKTFLELDLVKELVDLLRVIDTIKHSKSPAEIAALLGKQSELCRQIYPPGIVPTRHYMNEEVATEFAKSSPLRQLFHYLPSWNARGFLTIEKPSLLPAIVERLKSRDAILSERLSPAEILMAWKRYERYEQQLQRKYGNSVHMAELRVDEPISRQRKRPGVGPTVYEALPVVLNAFADAYSTSFQNFESTKGEAKFLIAVDVRPVVLQQPLFGARYMTAADAISCLLSIATKKEPSIEIDAFSAAGLTPLTIKMEIDQIAASLFQIPAGHVNLGAALSKAGQIGSNFVIFVTDRHADEADWFKDYRKTVDTFGKNTIGNEIRIVLWFLNRRPDNASPIPVCDDILVVYGWNQFVPEVIWSYARGELNNVSIKVPPPESHRNQNPIGMELI